MQYGKSLGNSQALDPFDVGVEATRPAVIRRKHSLPVSPVVANHPRLAA